MEIQLVKRDTAPMNERECDDLLELAINTAYQAFKHVTDDHVQGVFERLVWNCTHGLGNAGAVTVH